MVLTFNQRKQARFDYLADSFGYKNHRHSNLKVKKGLFNDESDKEESTQASFESSGEDWESLEEDKSTSSVDTRERIAQRIRK